MHGKMAFTYCYKSVKIMWTKTAEERLKELGLTKDQIDKLSDEANVGVNIITEVLLKAKQMGLVK